MKIKQRKTTLFLRNVPTDLKAHFKAYCAKRGVTMLSKIVDFMKEKTKEERKHDRGIIE